MTSSWLVAALFFCCLALLILAVGVAVMWRQLERERQTQQGLSAELKAQRQRAADLASELTATVAAAAATTAPATAAPEAKLLPSQTEQDEQASFSYTVSHDLRAPIRVVEGFTKIVKEDYGRVMDRIGNDHLDRVLAAAARMNSMIDALLALSQLSTQPLAQQPVNLSQLASFVADDLRRQSPERAVTLQIEPGLLTHGDPTLLRMVLENLIGNAWKYTGKCAQPMVVFERGEPAPHSASNAVHTFTVRDNGAGFDMRFSDRLFGVFQRLHSVNDFPGTGVGLASVRRIVRRHGGEIWADAEVDKGAAFHFSLRA
jgi:light-regulated signal transduction histidine kinase (bacteriophytochrome)